MHQDLPTKSVLPGYNIFPPDIIYRPQKTWFLRYARSDLTLSLLEERVRSDLKHLKNRILVLADHPHALAYWQEETGGK